MSQARICVCGDVEVGKSSLISSLVKDVFVNGPIQPTLPQISIPPTLGTPDNVTTIIADTSALPQHREELRKEIRRAHVILLVYSDHYSFERVSLFWMPYFRSLGVNVPVVLCANKIDLTADDAIRQVVQDEMLPIMAEFKEIDSCVKASAREHHNVNEAFYLCQKAVTHPISPLFDSKEMCFKPAAITALKRIFDLCDSDRDGILSDRELQAFQEKVFEKPLSENDLRDVQQTVRSRRRQPPPSSVFGIDEADFMCLNQLFVEKGRHETLWMILRKFHYTDSLSLHDSYLHPRFEVPPLSSAELSPLGYRFFVDLFLLFDKDNNGGLDLQDLQRLFAPTPGMPTSWIQADFPLCTVRDDNGNVTLQGWLAQWCLTTFTEPKVTLEYLAYFGFESPERGGITSALKVTKARKRRGRAPKVERNVFLCYVIGASHSGKSALLSAFLHRTFDATYHPTIRPKIAVNSVELHGGRQCHLILEELGELESAILDNQVKLDACDIICYTYDSSDPESFAKLLELRKRHPKLDDLPGLYAALKADKDKAIQRCEMQPDQYTNLQKVPNPLHVSVTWNSISELFVQLGESSLYPSSALPKKNSENNERGPIYIGLGAAICAALALLITWRRHQTI